VTDFFNTETADEKLFQLVLTNPNYILSLVLSNKTDQCYRYSELSATDNFMTKVTGFSVQIILRHGRV